MQGKGNPANEKFHGSAIESAAAEMATKALHRDVSYAFYPHRHPYLGVLIQALIDGSVRGLQAADDRYLTKADGSWVELPGNGGPYPVHHEQIFSTSVYAPSSVVAKPWPVNDIDFTSAGAYAGYNWELFYHIPMTVAIHLSRNQRFDEAQRWFHYVFDPTDSGPGPTPQRFWKVRAFHQSPVEMIEQILVNLSTGADEKLRERTIQCIMAWKDKPFRPHLVARYRPTAYMLKAFTAYLDNLIAWGDSLFREDTGEAINEATQLYVLAANILGPRPQEVPRKGWQRPQTYASLRTELDELSNLTAEIEVDVPYDIPPHQGDVTDDSALATIKSIGSTLYFCVPRNDRLMGYWDTVADRLFKIRNSLNIQGVFRQLPLFEPPIDPALLARATAAGLDIGAVVAGLNQPLPLVRFSLLLGKAAEICQQVTALGGQLLSAIEKEDGEALAILRAKHERVVLGLAEVVRYEQWQQAIKSCEAVEKSFAAAVQRYTHYERMLGKKDADISIPELDALDTDTLAAMSPSFTTTEPVIAPRDIEIDIAGDLGASGGKLMSSFEADELGSLGTAQVFNTVAGVVDTVGAGLAAIPQFEVAAKPMGAGSGVTFGGSNLASMMNATAAANRAIAAGFTYAANLSSKIASYARRMEDWAVQSNTAAAEITQTYKQLRAAQITEAIAEKEWRNHQQQIRQAEEIERFLTDEKTGKTSGKALYTWLRREVRGRYGQCFQFAFDVARKAERALQHELGDPNLTFLQFGYLSGRQALLAGEKLQLDLKRMELAYHELNQREYELTRHVSLRQLDPVALLALRTMGSCTISLPEELFDLDCPGHYFRRIKSVGVSVPCVVGPYASVNVTLTLTRSSVRRSPALNDNEDPYARDGDDTERFTDYFGRIQSIVTSSGTNDSGLFETNLRDERYLPFEGSGVISEWNLSLPTAVKQFDHNTIADVVLHVRYTAREGGVPLRGAAETHLAAAIAAATTVGSVRLLSLRHDFPTEWARFTAAAISSDGVAALTVPLREELYPYWASAGPIALHRIDVYATAGNTGELSIYDDEDATVKLAGLTVDNTMGGLLYAPLPQAPPAPQTLPDAVKSFTWYLTDNTITDLYLALTWGAPAGD